MKKAYITPQTHIMTLMSTHHLLSGSWRQDGTSGPGYTDNDAKEHLDWTTGWEE